MQLLSGFVTKPPSTHDKTVDQQATAVDVLKFTLRNRLQRSYLSLARQQLLTCNRRQRSVVTGMSGHFSSVTRPEP